MSGRTAKLLAGLFLVAGGAWAGGPDAPAGSAPDKSGYTLFNPTPEKLWRDFNPDRPSQFTGPLTVDAGHFQLEMDLANDTLDRHNPEHARVDVDQWYVATFDLRVGLTNRTEIDFFYDGYLNVRTIDHTARTNTVQSGFGDLTLLFKYNLFGNDGGAFSFGILPYLKIPTNTANLGNKRVEGGIELPLSINLPANFQLGLQTEFDAVRNDADTRFEAAFTNIAYLGYTFLDKKLTLYGEWYSRVTQGPDSQVDGEVDTGLIYYVWKNAEVDFGCNFGVTRAAPDFEPFAGFSVRFNGMTSLADDLRRLLDADAATVADDPATLAAHSGDKWFATAAPEAVVLARTTEDVSRTLRYCSGRGVPVTARGAGYGYVGGCVPVQGGVALSLARMNRLVEVDGRDFVAVVQPGVITGDLQTAARAKGLFYPPDPASLKHSTVGGNIATNAGGPRCLKYGVTRHYVLGLEVVLAGGEVVRCGGRTHKNKTGFDLVGLFVGSEGLLGVVTEATVRLLPMPQARAALSCGFSDMAAAAAAVQAIFAAGWLPAALEIADRFTLEAARGWVGAAQVPPGDAHLLVELDGREKSLRGEIADLRDLLLDSGALAPRTAVGDADCEQLWELRRKFSESLKATGLIKLNEDVAVPRGRLVDLVDFGAELQRRHGFPIACFGHAGDGNIHVNVMVADHDQPAVRARAEQALDELFTQVIAWGGAITGEHGVGLAKRRWWPQALSAENRALHRRLKEALDPAAILNPGKFLDPAAGR